MAIGSNYDALYHLAQAVNEKFIKFSTESEKNMGARTTHLNERKHQF